MGLIYSLIPGFRRFLTRPATLEPAQDEFGMTRSFMCWSKKEVERSLEFLFRHSIIISLSFRTHEGRHVRRRMGEESPDSWYDLILFLRALRASVRNNHLSTITQSIFFLNTRNGHPLIPQCTYPEKMY